MLALIDALQMRILCAGHMRRQECRMWRVCLLRSIRMMEYQAIVFSIFCRSILR